MKRQVKRWLSVMMVALLAFVNMGAVMVEPVPMEEPEKEGLVEFRNNSLLCDTGCGGHYAQYGQAVLAQGFDRTQNNAPVVFCSYPLACETCGKHTWSHIQVELPEELVKEAAELIW